MKSEEEIRELIRKSDVTTGPDADKKILGHAVEHLSQLKRQSSAKPWPSIWRTIMKSPITKIATAAVVIIACVIGLSLWRTTGSGIALADVLARMEQVKAFRCQYSEKVTGENSSETRATFLISQEYGWKTTYEELDPNGGESTFEESYRLPDKKTLITILHKQKKYKRTEWDDRWWELWQKGDPRTLLKKIVACKHESLGRSTIDGIEVEGFQTTDPNWLSRIDNRKAKVEADVKMWADVKTRLPVRYDVTTAYFDQMGDKIIEHDHWLMHDFQWDVPVDAADFEPVIPDDYTGTVIKYPAHITEETAIEGLKLCVELFGNYPDPERFRNFFTALLSALEKSETPAAMRLKEEIKGLTQDEIGNKLVDFLMPLRGLARFYIELQWWDNKDPAHYGKSVTPKDADKVLMRWKVSDNEYRVIFGDLHAETVAAEKLTELERNLPK